MDITISIFLVNEVVSSRLKLKYLPLRSFTVGVHLIRAVSLELSDIQSTSHWGCNSIAHTEQCRILRAPEYLQKTGGNDL